MLYPHQPPTFTPLGENMTVLNTADWLLGCSSPPSAPGAKDYGTEMHVCESEPCKSYRIIFEMKWNGFAMFCTTVWCFCVPEFQWFSFAVQSCAIIAGLPPGNTCLYENLITLLENKADFRISGIRFWLGCRKSFKGGNLAQTLWNSPALLSARFLCMCVCEMLLP